MRTDYVDEVEWPGQAPGSYVPPEAVAADSASEEEQAFPAVRFVTVDEFANAAEEGEAALLGDADNALIPENGDAMIYGDGGAGKTTLAVDLACHFAAGDDWLGIPVGRQARVLLIENEGPRPLFRRKLQRKLAAWACSPIEDRIRVLEEPWARFTFADPLWREALAAAVSDHEADVVIVGPLASAGMEAAGTLQEVRAFLDLVAAVRSLSGRRLVVVIVHHENKGGKVSGAWEGAGDTPSSWPRTWLASWLPWLRIVGPGGRQRR